MLYVKNTTIHFNFVVVELITIVNKFCLFCYTKLTPNSVKVSTYQSTQCWYHVNVDVNRYFVNVSTNYKKFVYCCSYVCFLFQMKNIGQFARWKSIVNFNLSSWEVFLKMHCESNKPSYVLTCTRWYHARKLGRQMQASITLSLLLECRK